MRSLLVLWRSTVGRKALVAASGAVLWGWVVLHLAGNVTVLAGPAATDHYAAALHRSWPLLWAVRAGLVLAAALHVAGATSLARRARAARPPVVRAAGASRTMRVGGALLLVFVVLHLLHLTFGVLHPAFVAGRVYANLVVGLRPPLVAAGYLAASALLGLHLHHGLWSFGRSLGWRGLRRSTAATLAAVTAVGFASIPAAVLVGVLR